MSTDPTAEHIDAVARCIDYGHHPYGIATTECHDAVRRLLTSTDPTVHAALAASLPAEVMLAALVDRGTLTGEVAIRYEKPLATPDMDGTTVRTYTTQVTEVTAEAAMKVKAPLAATGHRIVRRVASDWREVAP